MYDQPSLLDTPNAISSRESADGRSRSEWPGGLTRVPSGRDPAHANLSARQAREQGLLTNATCGPTGIGSSASASLRRSLGSRLRALMDCAGSTLFALTWSFRTTPAGRSIYRLRASAHRTSGSGFGSWPTTKGTDGEKGARTHRGAMLELNRKGPGADLPTIAAAAWHSPTSNDATGKGYTYDQGDKSRPRLSNLGLVQSGSPAATAKPGQLNPEHSRWLMGYPPEWGSCAPTVTPSSRRSQRK